MDKEERINQITKQVKILERVPRDKRIEVFNRGAKNIYVVGSILLLIVLWIVIFGSTILEVEPLWQLNRGLMRNTWNIIGKLFFFVFLPCIFIIRFSIEIRNYIIKRISIWLAMRLRICSHSYPQTCAGHWTDGGR